MKVTKLSNVKFSLPISIVTVLKSYDSHTSVRILQITGTEQS